MDYVEIEPHPLLRPHVKCFWALRVPAAPPAAQRVLPDGCCELVLHCGDRFRQLDEEGAWVQPRRLFVGPTARALVLEPGREIDVVAIRFKPGGAALMVGVPLSELRDAVADCDELGVRFGYDVIDVLSPLDAAARIEMLQRLLLRRLGHIELDRGVWHAQEMLLRSGGAMRIDEVARHAGTSVRQLQRRFHARVGLSPKVLARLVRLQRAIGAAHTPGSTLGRVAAEAGYSDQAHFTREFSAIAGVTPAQFFREDNSLNELFFSADAQDA